MATKKLFGALLLSVLYIFTSCIQDEAPNAECDIIAVKQTWIDANKEMLSGVPAISNNEVRFYVKEETSNEHLKQLNPEFELTHGARITKEERIEENGNRGIYMYYRTSSEDGAWSKEYKVSFTKQTVIDTDATFSFEHFGLDSNNKYYIWHELDASGTRLDWWASGNSGFAFIGSKPADFPTVADEAGYKGCCVKLITKDTGIAGAMAKAPIAAGNIFIGEFKLKSLKEAVKSTLFGLPIAPSRPVALTGYYKYTPGDVYTVCENGKKVEAPELNDTCAIYSVLYEIDPDNFERLNGENILSSERIVMIAQLEQPGEPSEWTPFEAEYKPVNGKSFDRQKLENGEYAITVVASSSKDGAKFNGAVNSTLYIDEIKIIWDNK